MSIETMKKGLCSLKLEKMSKVYNKLGEVDPTMVRCTFSILDFSASGNKQIISKQVGLNCMDTLKYKPLVCDYVPTTDYETPNDDFVEHDEKNITLRNGEEYIASGTTPIGVCEDVYMGISKDDNDEDIDVIMGDFLLWLYRYPNEISLIDDFYRNGETLYTSCEHYYKSSSKDSEGNEIIDSFIFDGHTVLGRGIEPAYASSKLISFNENWTKAINKKRNKSTNKKESGEMENAMFNQLKSLNAISSGDYRYKIYNALSEVMIAKDYENLWISNYSIYPTEGYFIVEVWEEDKYKQYKITFTVDSEDKVTVDYEGRTEVEYALLPVADETVQASLNAKTIEVETLNTTLGEKEEVIKSLNAKVEALEPIQGELDTVKVSLDASNELVISLNTKVQDLETSIDTMKPIVEAHQEAEYQKVLNSVTEIYKEKFEKVGASELFESEETQELVKKSINSIDLSEVNEYKFQLNQLIIDNISTKLAKEDVIEPVRSTNSIVSAKENKNLLADVVDEFEEKYGFKK